jgi:hypothetical protein
MSVSLPVPSTTVVLSLSMTTRLALPEIVEHGVLELEAGLFGDDPAAGQDGDVLPTSPCGGRRSPAP